MPRWEVIANALDGQALTDTQGIESVKVALVRIRSIRPCRGEDA